MVWAALALAGERPPTFERGATEVQMGSAFYQTAGHAYDSRDLGSVNLNGEYRRQVVRGFFFGVQGAVHGVTFHERDAWTLVARVESKVGLRVRLGPTTQLDTMVGVAVDMGTVGMLPGPVASLGLRQWLGRHTGLFVSLEPRLAPLAWGNQYMIHCDTYCPWASTRYNPGGTGVLFAFGGSFRSRPVSEIE